MKLSHLICFCIFTSPLLAQPKNSPEHFLRLKRKKIDVILRAADFRKHDVVADVGAGEGWLDAALGVYVDSVQFFLEDVDSAFLSSKKLQEALNTYGRVRGKPITCSYQQSVGSEKSTCLPTAAFDKIMLIETFHHFDFRNEMLTDLLRVLKPGGKLIVLEVIARRGGEKYKGCKRPIFTYSQITQAFSTAGFVPGLVYKTVNSYGSKVRVFTFTRKMKMVS